MSCATLKDKLLGKQSGIITYGMTPPKKYASAGEGAGNRQTSRSSGCGTRASTASFYMMFRTSRSAPTRTGRSPIWHRYDPTVYYRDYLQRELGLPAVVSRSVAGESREELADWIHQERDEQRYSIFVGASSSSQQVQVKLPEAYRLSAMLNEKLLTGGVVIPERHRGKGDEHLRALSKQEAGCSFFISQATFDVEASKSFLSDYYYHCRDHGIEMAPILFNLAPAAPRPLIRGVNQHPKWLENRLIHSHDILDKSVQLSRETFRELYRSVWRRAFRSAAASRAFRPAKSRSKPPSS